MFNIHFLYYIKWFAILEVILVITLLLFCYLAKIYYSVKQHFYNKNKKQLTKTILLLAETKQHDISKKIAKLKKYPTIILEVLPLLDNVKSLPYIQQVKTIIIENILKPYAGKLVKSKSFFKRLTAVKCFQYGINQIDFHDLIELIKDDRLLISLNAAKLAVKKPNSEIVNTIIDTYSKGRRLQQSLFTELLVEADLSIIPVIIVRLAAETNPYINSFCYRLLTQLPVEEVSIRVKKDIQAENNELKIAAIKYFAHQGGIYTSKTISNYLSDDSWQVRLTAIKILCKLKDEKSIPLIGEKLQDKEWWVRLNAAKALIKMGEPGISILKSQDPSKDKYAYEVASLTLLRSKKDQD